MFIIFSSDCIVYLHFSSLIVFFRLTNYILISIMYTHTDVMSLNYARHQLGLTNQNRIEPGLLIYDILPFCLEDLTEFIRKIIGPTFKFQIKKKFYYKP